MADPQHSERKWDITPKQIVVGLLVLVLVLFGALNTHQVNLDFIVGDADISLIFVIAASALIGFALGWIVKARADRE